jgi:hypothetical protein
MAQEVRVHRAVGDGEFEVRDEEIGELLPDEFGIGFLSFHF